MAATTLPDFRKFNVDSEPTSLGVRWKKWLLEFENLIVALNVTDKKRQRALMLFYGGDELHEIYRSLCETNTDEEFDDAKRG